MSERRLFLDRGVGESRGVVTLDGAPERLILQRDEDDPRTRLGARLAARVASLEPALATAFLDLGGGAEAILPFKPDARPVRGALVEVEIRAEPRRGKTAVARLVGPAEGEPRIITPAPDLPDLLRSHARETRIVEGRPAREVADEAEAAALEVLHALPGGGVVAIEPTRALTAVDVDVGERKGADSKRVARQANLDALRVAARLLRLKGLGGLVVVDLVGRGHDGPALLTAARTAFAPDNPGVAIGPVGRFGTMEISLPRRWTPLAERLLDERGAPTDLALSLRLLRRMEDEAAIHPGGRIQARAGKGAAALSRALLPRLTERFGARLQIETPEGWPRDRLEVFAG